jgi:chemotaxis signal transduction protein
MSESVLALLARATIEQNEGTSTRGMSMADANDASGRAIRDESVSLRQRARGRQGMADLVNVRVGAEWFALELSAVETVVHPEDVSTLPDMPTTMIGMLSVDGELMPLFSPSRVLQVTPNAPVGMAVVVAAHGVRVAISVDEAVAITGVSLEGVRDVPALDAGDGVLLGVFRFGAHLVALLDAPALAAACLAEGLGTLPSVATHS